MNRLRNTLVSFGLAGLLAVSGCGIKGFTIGGYEPVDLSKSYYAYDIEKKADELAESNNVEDKKTAIEAYGSIGLLKRMDENIRDLIKKNLNSGMTYAEIGDKYHKMHKKKK